MQILLISNVVIFCGLHVIWSKTGWFNLVIKFGLFLMVIFNLYFLVKP